MKRIALRLFGVARGLRIYGPCTLLAMMLWASPAARPQDVEAAQELQDLVQQMAGADDICPYMPRLRTLVNRVLTSDPEVYESVKPQLDEFNRTADETCTGADEKSDKQEDKKEEDSKVVDVRFTTQETRMLTDEEFATLRNGLHYEPESAQLSLGGTATSRLVDGQGHALASVTIDWIRTDNPSKYPVGQFRLTLQNLSTCLFSSSASLVIPGNAIHAEAVSSVTWSGWVTLHDPGRGETNRFEGSAPLGNNYPQLVLTPRLADYSLSQCRTVEQKPEPPAPE